MNKGDALPIVLGYTINGEEITQGQFDEIEFMIGENRYLLSTGDIVWDEDVEHYVVFLEQRESFTLDRVAKCQCRFKLGDRVFSSKIKYLGIGDTMSNEVI